MSFVLEAVFSLSETNLTPIDYAQKNRMEWEEKGHEVVATMVEEMRRKHGP